VVIGYRSMSDRVKAARSSISLMLLGSLLRRAGSRPVRAMERRVRAPMSAASVSAHERVTYRRLRALPNDGRACSGGGA